MTTTESSVPDVADSPPTREAESIDGELRRAIETIESPEYQSDNPAFRSLTARDAVLLTTLYVVIPVVLAVAVWLA